MDVKVSEENVRIKEKKRPDGTLVSRKSHINGALHGEQKAYFANGNLRYIRQYKRGVKIGEHIEYRKSGIKMSSASYDDDGKYHGEQRTWYEDGKDRELLTWNHGILHGRYEKWTMKGRDDVRSNYTNGKLDGEFKNWRDDILIEHSEFKMGVRSGVHCTWTNGMPLISCTYLDGKLEGEYKKWCNGTLIEHSWYKEDRLHGLRQTWFLGGGPFEIGHYDNGTQIGKHTVFDRGNSIVCIYYCQNGLMVVNEQRDEKGNITYMSRDELEGKSQRVSNGIQISATGIIWHAARGTHIAPAEYSRRLDLSAHQIHDTTDTPLVVSRMISDYAEAIALPGDIPTAPVTES